MTDNPSKRDQLEDRLVDMALREKLSGSAPPDLSEEILAPKVARNKAKEKLKLQHRLSFMVAGGITLLLVGMVFLFRPVQSQQSDVSPSAYYLSDNAEYDAEVAALGAIVSTVDDSRSIEQVEIEALYSMDPTPQIRRPEIHLMNGQHPFSPGERGLDSGGELGYGARHRYAEGYGVTGGRVGDFEGEDSLLRSRHYTDPLLSVVEPEGTQPEPVRTAGIAGPITEVTELDSIEGRGGDGDGDGEREFALEEQRLSQSIDETPNATAMDVKALKDMEERLKLTREKISGELQLRLLSASLQVTEAELKGTQESLTELAKRRGELEQQLTDTNKQLDAARLRFQLEKAEEVEAKLRVDAESLAKRLSELEETIADSGDEQPALPAAKVATTVLSREGASIAIAAGSGDGIQSGLQLDVLDRDGKFFGRAVVLETMEENAIARLLPEFAEAAIPEGAVVTTELDSKRIKPRSEKTWRRAKATPNASRLQIGDNDELPPEGAQINVHVDGFRARVVLNYYYFNDRDRQLEGFFKIRLPNEASLFHFAFGESAFDYEPQLDSLAGSGAIETEAAYTVGLDPKVRMKMRDSKWSNVKEARIVPREKAAFAYQDMTRKKIDPALVEWSGAGMFNAKVFPLAPNKLHRIVIGYDVNLKHVNDELVYELELPEDIGECEIDISADSSLGKLTAEPGVKPVETNGRNYYHFVNPKVEAIRLRQSPGGLLAIAGGDETHGEFFATEITPELPAGEEVAGSSHATFMLDTSLSSNPERMNLWLDLMRATLEKNRSKLTHFSLLLFNVENHWWRKSFVANTSENVEKAIAYCETLALEGATDLRSAIGEAANPAWSGKRDLPTADLFLLSDGAATWGETNLHLIAKPLKSGSALFAYKTGLTGEATGVLEHLARESGGAVFSVASEEEIPQAAVAHRKRPWRLAGMHAEGGSDLMIAGRPNTIYPGQRLLIVGRGKIENGAEIVFQLERDGQKHRAATQVEQTIESNLAPRLFGQVAVGQLESLFEASEKIAVAYARHFEITGHTCSLLMLDTEEDYERYNIKPEDDAFVVSSTSAAETMTTKLEEVGQRLEDPKQSLLHWLAKLEKMPGVEFEISTALQLALDRLPASAFDIQTPKLNCRSRLWKDLPKVYVSAINDSHKDPKALDYDTVVAEAARRKQEASHDDGLKALSTLIELNPDDAVLARDVAFTAMSWDLGGQAYPLLVRVAKGRPFEPQTFQAIARCLADMDNADLALVYYEVAVSAKWDDRFGGIREIASVEYMHLLNRIEQNKVDCTIRDYATSRLAALKEQYPLMGSDLVVTMMWNTDRTDVDLHVLEPTGETCSYENTQTKSGGRITQDVTQGYGPEMYVNKSAPHGRFQIKAHYFGSDDSRTTTRSKLYITVYENFGGRREKITNYGVQLTNQEETRKIATVLVEK